MRLNKNKLHLTAFILASFASLPVYVSAVFEKGDKRARIPGKLDDGQEILDYIVKLKDTSSYKSFVESSNEVQAMTTVKSLSFMNTQVLRFPSEGDAEAWCAERKDVKLCVKDERVYTMSETTPYGIGMVGALDIDYIADSGIKSCIIDSGYDLGHEDLPNDGTLLSGGGTCDDDPCYWYEDPGGHGTHVAGTMAALQDGGVGVVGVVRNGQMPMHIERALGSNGSGSLSGVLQSMHSCVSEGAKVINMSLGSGGSGEAYNEYFASLEADVLFVAAAGNGGNDSYFFPASVDSNKMMSVACVDSSSTRCSFSQYNDQVDIAAPGYDVLSTTPGNNYEGWSGTSMSSPHVAAVAALIWSHHPDASAAEIRNALEVSAIQPDPNEQFERNDDLGWGIVNAERALSVLDGTFTYPPSRSPSPTVAPTVSHQPSGECMPFDLSILPDIYPGETSWELFNPRGEVISSSSEEDPLVSDKIFVFQTCLGTYCADDSEYQFVIKDSYGDGIFSPGFYKVFLDGELLKSAGNYTFAEEVVTFSSCPTSAPTVSAPPSPAPIPVCADSTDKFFYKFKDDGTTPNLKKCSFFDGKSKGKRKKMCKTKAPAGSGHGSAKDVCPQTCDNCCDIEIEHLENEKANLKNEKEDLMKLVERYKYIFELYNIDV